MTPQEQVPSPSSLRDNEDVTMTKENPKMHPVGAQGGNRRVMHAEVIVIMIKSWGSEGGSQEDESFEAFGAAQKRVADYLAEIKEAAKGEETPLMADGKTVVVDEQRVEKFLYRTLKLNSTILRYSRMAAVVLVSLPPPPVSHPAYCYMEYNGFVGRKCTEDFDGKRIS